MGTGAKVWHMPIGTHYMGALQSKTCAALEPTCPSRAQHPPGCHSPPLSVRTPSSSQAGTQQDLNPGPEGDGLGSPRLSLPLQPHLCAPDTPVPTPEVWGPGLHAAPSSLSPAVRALLGPEVAVGSPAGATSSGTGAGHRGQAGGVAYLQGCQGGRAAGMAMRELTSASFLGKKNPMSTLSPGLGPGPRSGGRAALSPSSPCGRQGPGCHAPSVRLSAYPPARLAACRSPANLSAQL